MIKIGIPRGMNYFDFFPLWKEFFEELGAEVIVSKRTNKDILNMGVLNSVDDACLPVKIFHGHTYSIKDAVDYIFIPRIISTHKKEYECPKILGLPAMVKNTIPDLPKIIDIEINFRKNKFFLAKEIYKAANKITKDPIKIKSAYIKAQNKFEKYKQLLYVGIHPEDVMKEYNYRITKSNNKNLNILLIGHNYNLYDNYVNMDLFTKLQDMGVNIITPNMINKKNIEHCISEIPKRMFWTSGKKIIGSSLFMIREKNIDGIIFISSFGCGLDSILIDMVQREAKKSEVPFNLITLDEHSGEAGVNTRIEAFIDMIKWRQKDEDYFSTYG